MKPLRISLTDKVLQELKYHRERTGVGPRKLLSAKSNIPQGLSAAMVELWFSKKVLKVRQDHLKFVLATWEALPEARQGKKTARVFDHGFVKIPAATRQQLQEYRQQSGIGPISLLKQTNGPLGLTSGMIQSWLGGAVKTAKREHLQFVLDRWSQLTRTEKTAKRVAVTDDVWKQLLAYREQGWLPGQILKDATDVPPGLKATIISSWFSRNPKLVRQDYLEFVLLRCQQLAKQKSRRIKITVAMHTKIIKQQHRTGIGPKALLKTVSEIPQGLTAGTVENWLSKNSQTAWHDYYQWTIEQWQQLPDA